MFIAALFTVARTQKQPKCPSTDEWIKKMWHIYTMGHYSAIKRNKIDLFVVRWMDLESVIQSEMSERKKQILYANTYIWNLKKKKNGHEEPRGKMGIMTQTYQRMDLSIHRSVRVSWDKVREWHGHTYTTKCKIECQLEAAAQHREISSVLCDHLQGWDMEGGREGHARVKRYGDICICITHSLCYKAEIYTPL